MGATEVCPGTYMCGNEYAADTCADINFQVSGKDNLWRTGDGLLMNQQSFHRGAAHVDPNAPDRVVFIVTFAPRPLEGGDTRLLGQGGSYSLRWDMWGHTLKDLENAPTMMVQPWRTLRALGMYKPKGANWGWDFISQHSMRCSAFDTGYESEDDFFSTISFVPRIFLSTFEKDMTYSQFFEACTRMWQSWAVYANIAAIACFVIGSTCLCCITALFNKQLAKGVGKGALRTSIRVTILYGLIASFAYYVFHYWIAGSIWATEIKNGTLFYPPYITANKNKALLDRAAVVIDEHDVLISDRLNHRFLASLADTPQYHPGNMNLGAVIRGAVEVVPFLRGEDKIALANVVVENVIDNGSNFAVLSDDAVWVPMLRDEAQNYVLNKLCLQDNSLISALNREAEFLLSLYRYGRFKSSAMARTFSPIMIHSLMDRIFAGVEIPVFGMFRFSGIMSKKRVQVPEAFGKNQPHSGFHLANRQHRRLPHWIQHRTSQTNHSSKQSLFYNEKNVTSGDMLQIGDMVEGQYNGIQNEVCDCNC